jgi:hypothetical protein
MADKRTAALVAFAEIMAFPFVIEGRRAAGLGRRRRSPDHPNGSFQKVNTEAVGDM